MAYTASPFDSYTQSALEQAQGLMGKSVSSYPSYIPSQTKAPAQYDYYNYTPTSPIAQINQPNYKGMMEGDYDKLQQALTSPGATAATNAYNTGLQGLNSAMSGRGLYGSSIMGNQQVNSLDRVYQQAMADNAAKAAATRYGMQQQDLSDYNKFMAQNFATDVGQQKNIFAANAAENQARMGYDASKLAFTQSQDSLMRDWENKSAYEKYTYDLAKAMYQNQADETLMNRALALAGQGAPLTQAGMNYQMAQQQNETARQAAADASAAANTASWLGAGGTLAGGLMGGYNNWSQYAGNSGLGSYLSSLWG